MNGEVESLCFGLRETVGSRHVVQDGEVLQAFLSATCFSMKENNAKRHITYGELDTGVAGHVNVANIGASTIGVDLVEGDCDFAPSLDLRHGLRGQGILSVFSNVNVSLELCASTRIDDIGFYLGISNDGRVLLARVDADAISSNRGVDFKGGVCY